MPDDHLQRRDLQLPGAAAPSSRPRGHALPHHSDTGSCSPPTRRRGPDCLPRLRGMFAFALWDRARGTLFWRATAFGEKPLYYSATATPSSSPPSSPRWLAYPAFAPRARPHALDEFLHYKYVPGAGDAARRGAQLPPGHKWRPGAPGAPPIFAATTRRRARKPDPARRLPWDASHGRGLPGGARRGGPAAQCSGRAPRGVPLRRHRQLRDRGPDGRAVGPAGAAPSRWGSGEEGFSELWVPALVAERFQHRPPRARDHPGRLPRQLRAGDPRTAARRCRRWRTSRST